MNEPEVIGLPIAGDNAWATIEAQKLKSKERPGDCGIDLYPMAASPGDIHIQTYAFYQIWSIPTQVSIAVPEGHFAWIVGRSSSYDKLGGCLVIPGIIDHGYTGEYRIRVQVPYDSEEGKIWLTLQVLDFSQRKIALAQFIIIPFARCEMEFYIGGLPQTKRGSRGYGSTDKIKVTQHETGQG